MELSKKTTKKRTKSQLERLAKAQRIRRKEKKEEYEELADKCSKLTLENEQLRMELDQQNQINKIHQVVFNNTVNLIQSLPHNSPYRRPLLFWFTKNLTMEEALGSYGISKRSYNRILEEEDSEVVARKICYWCEERKDYTTAKGGNHKNFG
jgi:hypothetical protein